jgi:hypothetical protein
VRGTFGRLALVALTLIGAASSACFLGKQGDRVVPLRLADVEYEAAFPYYAQLCAVSRFHRLGVERGGNAGHAVLYLKGLCRVPDAPYPQVELCPERVDDVDDPRHGVGVSVNAAFQNVNWVAYPGRHLFFNGNLKPGDVLDQAHFERTIDVIVDQGLLRGVEVNESSLTGILPGTLEHRTAESLLGTDTAIRFARSVWCSSLPATRAQMEAIVAHLNEVNRTYATTGQSYVYSLFSDNCVDLLHNTLAAAGVWEPKSQYRLAARKLMNIGIPANEFVRFSERANRFPIERFRKVYADGAMRESLARFGALPARHGALLQSAAVHTPNELYDTSLQMYVVEGPGKRQTESITEIMNDVRVTDLGANLRWWETRYAWILEEPPQRGGWLAGADYAQVQGAYREYLSEQLADVRRLLGEANAADGAAR